MTVKKNASKRRAKIPKAKSSRVRSPKVRNGGTMTEYAFWSFIRSTLRQKSMWWKPITQCKLNAKRAYKGPNKRQKFEYQCNGCCNWFPQKQINVDHIKPAGSLTCAKDLPGFVERLFCEIDNLQVLCTECHDRKTKLENKW
jgi:5-methylcytosine-specific restriction endonuclease McrA